jgi:hypothetical protein
LLYQSPVDTFVIVSSDSDFAPLASKLRSAGKTIIGAGHESTASRVLVTSCDKYFYLPQNANVSRSTPTSEKEQREADIQKLVQRAIKASIDEQGKVFGSKLNVTLQRLEPSFDYKALGYPNFAKFIESISWLKVTRTKGSGDITIEVSDQNINGKLGDGLRGLDF